MPGSGRSLTTYLSPTFTAGSVCLCGVCSPWSVCEVVVVPNVVNAVIAVTVMVTAMLVWGPGEVWLR